MVSLALDFKCRDVLDPVAFGERACDWPALLKRQELAFSLQRLFPNVNELRFIGTTDATG